MRYTSRTAQSHIVEAEGRIARQREMVDQRDRHPADEAVARLLVMEQCLLSMKRFLETLERDLAQSLGMPMQRPRLKSWQYRTKTKTGAIAQPAGVDAPPVDETTH